MHRYYTLNRPPMPGGIPKDGLVRVYAYDTRLLVLSINRWAWGYAEYSRPLTAQEITEYELAPEIGGENDVRG